jgi:hypothetical protein
MEEAANDTIGSQNPDNLPFYQKVQPKCHMTSSSNTMTIPFIFNVRNVSNSTFVGKVRLLTIEVHHVLRKHAFWQNGFVCRFWGFCTVCKISLPTYLTHRAKTSKPRISIQYTVKV